MYLACTLLHSILYLPPLSCLYLVLKTSLLQDRHSSMGKDFSSDAVPAILFWAPSFQSKSPLMQANDEASGQMVKRHATLM